MAFKPAERKSTFALIGLTGMSGSGKTMSALLMARGLAGPDGKIAVIDTENGRASIYDELTPYDTDELWAPFSPDRYLEKIIEAENAGYDVLVIDSGSHEWEGTGGVLEMADSQTDSRGKQLQGLRKWQMPKTAHKKFVNRLLQSRMHVILCLRGKEKLIQTKDDRGREVIVSDGIKPITDERLVYEMTVSLIMEQGATYRVAKCPEGLLPAFPGDRVTVETGAKIREWLSGGAPVDQGAELLRREARERADEGTEAFRAWWADLTKPRRALLKAIIPDLQAAAKSADERMAAMDAGGDDDGDPFGEPEAEESAPADDFPGDQPARLPFRLLTGSPTALSADTFVERLSAALADCPDDKRGALWDINADAIDSLPAAQRESLQQIMGTADA